MPLYMRTLVAAEKTEDAITMGEEWNYGGRPNELANEEWHGFQLELARTYRKADTLTAEKPEDADARLGLSVLASCAEMRYPGREKQNARDLLALPNLPGGLKKRIFPLKTLTKLAKGKELTESAQAMEFTIKTLPERLRMRRIQRIESLASPA